MILYKNRNMYLSLFCPRRVFFFYKSFFTKHPPWIAMRLPDQANLHIL